MKNLNHFKNKKTYLGFFFTIFFFTNCDGQNSTTTGDPSSNKDTNNNNTGTISLSQGSKQQSDECPFNKKQIIQKIADNEKILQKVNELKNNVLSAEKIKKQDEQILKNITKIKQEKLSPQEKQLQDIMEQYGLGNSSTSQLSLIKENYSGLSLEGAFKYLKQKNLSQKENDELYRLFLNKLLSCDNEKKQRQYTKAFIDLLLKNNNFSFALIVSINIFENDNKTLEIINKFDQIKNYNESDIMFFEDIMDFYKNDLKNENKVREYHIKYLKVLNSIIKPKLLAKLNKFKKAEQKDTILVQLFNEYIKYFKHNETLFDKDKKFLNELIVKIKKIDDKIDINMHLFRVFKNINDEIQALNYFKNCIKGKNKQDILKFYKGQFEHKYTALGIIAARFENPKKYLLEVIKNIKIKEEDYDDLINLSISSKNWDRAKEYLLKNISILQKDKNKNNKLILQNELKLLEVIIFGKDITEIKKQTTKFQSSLNEIKTKHKDLYNYTVSSIFLAYIRLNNFDGAISFLKKYINDKEFDQRATMSLSALLVSINESYPIKNIEKVKQIYLLLLNKLKNVYNLKRPCTLNEFYSMLSKLKTEKNKDKIEKLKGKLSLYYQYTKMVFPKIKQTYTSVITSFYSMYNKVKGYEETIIDLINKCSEKNLYTKINLFYYYQNYFKKEQILLEKLYKSYLIYINKMDIKDKNLDIYKIEQKILKYYNNKE